MWVLKWRRAGGYDPKENLICHFFGHRWESGWWSQYPHLTIREGPHSGNGLVMLDVYCKCSRCDETTRVGVIDGASAASVLANDEQKGVGLRNYVVTKREKTKI